MKPQSQAICDDHWQRENLCIDTCPLAESCSFKDGDEYLVWQDRMENAAVEFNKLESK